MELCQIQLVYPDGTINYFAPDSTNKVYRSTFSAVTDFIVNTGVPISGSSTSTQYTLMRSSNQAYNFVSTPFNLRSGRTSFYCLTKILYSKGNTTNLTWGLFANTPELITITEPGANYITLSYVPLVVGKSARVPTSAPFITSVLASYARHVYARYSYTDIPPSSSDGITYTSFECLSKVAYFNTVEENKATYVYAMPTSTSFLSSGQTVYVFPELTSAQDIHAAGPESIILAYQDYTLPGAISKISDATGQLMESIDLSSDNTAGVIYTSADTTNAHTNEYQYTVDIQGQVTSITDIDSQNSVRQTCNTKYTVDPSSSGTLRCLTRMPMAMPRPLCATIQDRSCPLLIPKSEMKPPPRSKAGPTRQIAIILLM